MTWSIEFYKKENGISPVEEFIETLPFKFQAKAIRQIDLLEQFGVHLKEPYAKPIKGDEYKGLWELRIKFASDISRIFYFLPVGNCFVLLHGFIKKTDKIPKSEIDTAKKHMEDYLRRRQR
jgi:phage-related protein